MDALSAIKVIMRKHADAVNSDDGGERPFNEEGETLEAIDAILHGEIEWVIKSGWIKEDNGQREK